MQHREQWGMIKIIYMVHKCLKQNKGVSKLSSSGSQRFYPSRKPQHPESWTIFFLVYKVVFKKALCNLQVSSSETRRSLCIAIAELHITKLGKASQYYFLLNWHAPFRSFHMQFGMSVTLGGVSSTSKYVISLGQKVSGHLKKSFLHTVYSDTMGRD